MLKATKEKQSHIQGNPHKARRIQHHQNSFTTNAKGNYLGRKEKRRKTTTIPNKKR